MSEINNKTSEKFWKNRKISRLMFETTLEYIHILDIFGIILQSNPAFLKGSGYSKKEVVGRSLDEFFTLASRETFATHFPILLEKGVNRQLAELVCKDGTIITVDCSYSVVFNERREIIFLVTMQRDITKQKNPKRNVA